MESIEHLKDVADVIPEFDHEGRKYYGFTGADLYKVISYDDYNRMLLAVIDGIIYRSDLDEDFNYNCVNCEYCRYCTNCDRCFNCNCCDNNLYSSNCYKCKNCKDCAKCDRCTKCDSCKECNDCVKCKDCINCDDCKYCTKCAGCVKCFVCNDCVNCKECFGCNDCKECKECSSCNDCDNCEECSSCVKCDSCINCVLSNLELLRRYTDICLESFGTNSNRLMTSLLAMLKLSHDKDYVTMMVDMVNNIETNKCPLAYISLLHGSLLNFKDSLYD